MERIDLAAPYQPDPRTASDFRVARLDLNRRAQSVVVELVSADGAISYPPIVYDGAEAVALITALNKANLALKSLNTRILEKLVADGKLVGTIAGAAD